MASGELDGHKTRRALLFDLPSPHLGRLELLFCLIHWRRQFLALHKLTIISSAAATVTLPPLSQRLQQAIT